MIELRLGREKLDPADLGLAYQVRLFDVSEPTFDRLCDEDTRADLRDGVMTVHSPASLRHDALAGFIHFVATGVAGARNLGQLLGTGNALFRAASGRKFAPDAFFVAAARVPPTLPRVFDGPPDWVLEVLSPSNRAEDLAEKVPLYRDAGVPEIWVVDPVGRWLEAVRRSQAGQAGQAGQTGQASYTTERLASGWAASTAIPGFRLDVGWLWQEPLPNSWTCLSAILGVSSPAPSVPAAQQPKEPRP